MDPKRFRALDGLSQLYVDTHRDREAEEITRRLVEIAPDAPQFLLRLANVIDNQRHYVDSLDLYKQLISKFPTYANGHLDLAISLWRQEKSKDADSSFKKALELAPDRPFFYLSYGNFLKSQGKKKDAKVQYQMALKLDPEYADAKKALEELK
ncbi:MAG: tetratricopeptide repeat protein [Armatimonadetes bacterium]|nr:tetratricopeptide repeat protein [Armatimonadota bacterium]